MAILLVITADDLGLDARRDEGIARAHEHGRVTHASLVVTRPRARAAAREALRRGIPLGLHLNLTEGTPCARHLARGLTDAHGAMLGKHGLRAALAAGAVPDDALVAEAEAQCRRYEDLVGAAPAHVDGHQHAHVIPRVAEALAPCLAARGVASTRVPAQPVVDLADPVAKAFYEGVRDDALRARPIYARHAIYATDAFLGLDWSGLAARTDTLAAALDACAPARSMELMCHPGMPSRRGDAFNRDPGRAHELAVLTSDAMAALLARRDVALGSMRDLRDRGALS